MTASQTSDDGDALPGQPHDPAPAARERNAQRRASQTRRSGGRKTRHSDSVVVAVRLRPQLPREKQQHAAVAVAMKDNSCCVQAPRPDGKMKLKTITLDHCAPQDTSQEHMYRIVGRGLVDNAWNGYNSSLIAYGQTGSGKTYSVFGPPDVPPAELYNPKKLHKDAGVIPRVFTDIFSRIEGSEGEYVVEVAMMEIYLERVFDLLRGRVQMDIRGTNELGFFAEKVTKRRVHRYEDVVQVLKDGNGNKIVASTAVNSTSSRAHTLLEIYVRKLVSDSQVRANSAKIVIVDLAGSENVKQSEVRGELRQQASVINLSLMELGKVVEQVVDREFRRSFTVSSPTSTPEPPHGGGDRTPDHKSRPQGDDTPVRSPTHAQDASVSGMRTPSGTVSLSGSQKGTGSNLISFRGSALTKLLKESIGGNSKATILVTISPSLGDAPQTVNSLRFADRAKHLRNHAHFNEGAFSDNRTRLKIVNEEHKRLLQRHKFEQKYHELLEQQAKYEEDAAELRRQQKHLVAQVAQHREMTDAERAELKDRWARLTSEESRVRDTHHATTQDIERMLKVQAKLLRQVEAEKIAERSERARLEQVVAECLEDVERSQAQCANIKEHYGRRLREAESRASDIEARAALSESLAEQKAAAKAEDELSKLRLEQSHRHADHTTQLRRAELAQEHLREQVDELQQKLAWHQKQQLADGARLDRGHAGVTITPHGSLQRESEQLMAAFAVERERLLNNADKERQYYRQQVADLHDEMEAIRRKHEAVAGEHIARVNKEVRERLHASKAMATEREQWLREKKALQLAKRTLEAEVRGAQEGLRRLGDRTRQLDEDERRGWEEKHVWRARCHDLVAALRAADRSQRDVVETLRGVQGECLAVLRKYLPAAGEPTPHSTPNASAILNASVTNGSMISLGLKESLSTRCNLSASLTSNLSSPIPRSFSDTPQRLQLLASAAGSPPPAHKGIREIEGDLLKALKQTMAGFVQQYETSRIMDGEKESFLAEQASRTLSALEDKNEATLAQLEHRLKEAAADRAGVLQRTSEMLAGAPDTRDREAAAAAAHEDAFVSPAMSPSNASHRSSPSPSPSLPHTGRPAPSPLLLAALEVEDADGPPHEDGDSSERAGDSTILRGCGTSPLSSLRDSFASIPSCFALNHTASPEAGVRPSTPRTPLAALHPPAAATPERAPPHSPPVLFASAGSRPRQVYSPDSTTASSPVLGSTAPMGSIPRMLGLPEDAPKAEPAASALTLSSPSAAPSVAPEEDLLYAACGPDGETSLRSSLSRDNRVLSSLCGSSVTVPLLPPDETPPISPHHARAASPKPLGGRRPSERRVSLSGAARTLQPRAVVVDPAADANRPPSPRGQPPAPHGSPHGARRVSTGDTQTTLNTSSFRSYIRDLSSAPSAASSVPDATDRFVQCESPTGMMNSRRVSTFALDLPSPTPPQPFPYDPPAAEPQKVPALTFTLPLPIGARRASVQSSESERLVTSRPSDVISSAHRYAPPPAPPPALPSPTASSAGAQHSPPSLRERWEARKRQRGVS